jgi:hypothetical protein
VARNSNENSGYIIEMTLIEKLWYYGAFFGEVPASEVEEQNLGSLSLRDAVVRNAVNNYQWFCQSVLDELTQKYHGRAAIIDGDLGPATHDLLHQKRCGFPDYLPPKGKKFSHPFLSKNIQAGILEGNWPDDCRNRLHSSFDMSLRGLSQSKLEDLTHEAHKNWNDSLDVTLTFEKDREYARCDIYSKGKPLPGSTLAWSELAISDCTFIADQAYDTTISWSEPLYVTTKTHEDGHALGFNHVRDSAATMFWQINSAAKQRRGKPNATDLAEARKRGYRVGPPPEDPSNITGKVHLRQGGERRDFQYSVEDIVGFWAGREAVKLGDQYHVIRIDPDYSRI